MPTKKVTDKNFEAEVLKADKPVLVDFWAEWCWQFPWLYVEGTIFTKKSGPCKMVGPVLEELSDEMSDKVVIAKHNIEEEPSVPIRYGVRGIPTMLLFKSGEIFDTKIGAATKDDIKSWLNSKIG